jgi:predicted negative regulator of RcsB-dependent stress response
MDDYLSESEQWEHVKVLLRENTPWLIAGVAVAVLGIAGWRWNEARIEKHLLAAGGIYKQLTVAHDKHDAAEVDKLAARLATEYPGTGFADFGQLARAQMQVSTGQHAQAIEVLQRVMQTTKDKELALSARLRIARVQLDQNKYDEALATLNGVNAGAYAPRYAELRGDLFVLKGDATAALKAYSEAQASNSTAVDAELLKLKMASLSRS